MLACGGLPGELWAMLEKPFRASFGNQKILSAPFFNSALSRWCFLLIFTLYSRY